MIHGATIALLLFSTAAAVAQTDAPKRDDRLLREPYVTATGSTVDKPGVPQGSAPTALDRSLNRQDNAIDKSICTECR